MSKTPKKQTTSSKKSTKKPVTKKPATKKIVTEKFILKDLGTDPSKKPNSKITLKDFGMVPSKVAKKNENQNLTEFKIYVNNLIDSYLENDLDKIEKERVGKILNALVSYKDRLEKMHPAKKEDDSVSASSSNASNQKMLIYIGLP